jgi:hypothetical protein
MSVNNIIPISVSSTIRRENTESVSYIDINFLPDSESKKPGYLVFQNYFTQSITIKQLNTQASGNYSTL